ncbi:MAG: lipopolysaccharide biosynthesis protein [Ilumatobacteraceae bacterium]
MTDAESSLSSREASVDAPPTGGALPEGAVTIAVGLIIAGVATYAFFRVGASALGGDEEFAPIAAMWFAMFALAPGFFLPIEQELGRALAHRRALGEGGRPVVTKIAALTLVVSIVVVVGLAISSPWLTGSYFSGDWLMFAALIIGFLSYAPVHLSRGICSGQGRFTPFAVVVASDGVMKIVGTVALTAIGITAVGAYAFAIAVAPLFAVVAIGLRGSLRTEPGPPAQWREITQNFGWLLLGTACAAVLLNAGPIAANILASENEADAVTRFSYGVLLARVPLFMFQAIQASLLPRLARLAAQRSFDEFRRGLRLLVIVVAGIGVAGTIFGALLGPWTLRLVYDADLGGRTLAMLALSSALYMMALAVSQAVLALEDHAYVALGWVISLITFVIGTWLSSDDVFQRIEIGLVASSAAAVIAFGLRLRRRLSTLT